MADIYSRSSRPRPRKAPASIVTPAQGVDLSRSDALWFVEAIFLTYRDFIGEPDRILAEIGFGRAHHRVLYFVNRYPGMRVADLLDILQITKQSLARVLRELVREHYIRQISGETDRRERRLYPTGKGTALAMRLTELQLQKVQMALGAVGEEGRAAVATFFQSMAPDANRLGAFGREEPAPSAGGEE